MTVPTGVDVLSTATAKPAEDQDGQTAPPWLSVVPYSASAQITRQDCVHSHWDLHSTAVKSDQTTDDALDKLRFTATSFPK